MPALHRVLVVATFRRPPSAVVAGGGERGTEEPVAVHAVHPTRAL